MHKVGKQHLIYTMGPNREPVLRVKTGERVVFETCDCFEDQITSMDIAFDSLNWDRVNPATGPVFVEGAEPGDILSVTIEKITIADHGVMVTGPELGVLGGELNTNSIRILPIRNNYAYLNDSLKVPVNKMIGVIGTAPASEEISCGTPDLHGGNMDCKEIKEGATLLLPVNVEGGLLALGDLHGAMADGEVAVCGVETAGEVTVTIHVIKGKRLPLPMLINDSAIMTIASKKELDEAANQAVKNMAEFLVGELNFKKDEAIFLLSLAGDLKICQVVDPNKTARMELPLRYVEDKYDLQILLNGQKILS
ncbi:acetamidase/formamidase family protein [Bacillus sp. SJS]|uniref:acetamidase/formamidase family protein n=1 Tax=Bacillus sp. SJS TaxID=1423321 RepID=UPI0004DCF53F|nr:acetamidase/formamidase family protein [Bacillus sp. SJS]KZZ83648.1 acetamidase [Bacillus sp. SJS]